MIALAQLTRDPALIKALTDSDIHFESGKRVFGWKTIAESKADEINRRTTKVVNFGLVYGGAAASLAAQSGFPIEVVRELIEGFYKAFPNVRTWQTNYYESVANHPDHVTVLPGPRGTVRQSQMLSTTGRIYTYIEEPSPAWLARKTGLPNSFRPTQTKNYPVQGLATGDWVPLAVAMLHAHLPFQARMLNVVHDSILFEVSEEHQKGLALWLTGFIDETLPDALNTLGWGEPVVPLKVSFKTGKYWSTPKE
jgi:DNA polymerase I-like protein with 3'-5' exonuclease and polymerase domains